MIANAKIDDTIAKHINSTCSLGAFAVVCRKLWENIVMVIRVSEAKSTIVRSDHQRLSGQRNCIS